jgi:feruloyl-CoA synthase
MAEPASIDTCESTDKFYVNQRAELERRSAIVTRLFAQTPDEDVVLIDQRPHDKLPGGNVCN